VRTISFAPGNSTAAATDTLLRYREISRVNVQTSIEHTLRARCLRPGEN
jgi:hypothetical protein